MKSFYEIKFPEELSYNYQGGAEFSTLITETAGGNELRNQNFAVPKHKYTINFSSKSLETIESLQRFFKIVKGRSIGFRFKDWLDFTLNNELIAISDGSKKEYQIYKNYRYDEYSYSRKIEKIVKNSYVVRINDSVTEDYNLDINKGILTFSKQPAKGVKIIIDAEFDVPVRFNSDYLPFSIDDFGSYSCENIELIEIKL